MKIGVVVIGRNEGERLLRCLGSLPEDVSVVYVDSGSTDGSVAAAEAAGARVVELDMSKPFTAARARNAGRAALPPQCELIQFVDGDCALQPGWIATGEAALAQEAVLAAVFGRRRELAPEASIYNWMCDVEWAVTPGRVKYFGGDVLLRAGALDDAGGYPDEMIAGEEPDLAIRLRTRGWEIACLPAEMTFHDAAISRFSQWWRRMRRSGHAYAELASRHPGSSLHDYGRRLRRTLLWGVGIPLSGLLLLLLGIGTSSPGQVVAAVLLLLLPVFQCLRLTLRGRGNWPWGKAAARAGLLVLGKVAQSLGAAQFWRSSVSGRRSRLIEYKG